MDLPWWKQKYRNAMDGYCFGTTETQKEWDGKIPNVEAGENVMVLSCERRTDLTRVSWPGQKSHRLFLLAQTSFLCQQPLTNWVTHKIVKRPHGTSICSGEAQRADPWVRIHEKHAHHCLINWEFFMQFRIIHTEFIECECQAGVSTASNRWWVQTLPSLLRQIRQGSLVTQQYCYQRYD